MQTQPNKVRFTDGVEHLRCMRLSDQGMLRWYAGCCNTPIGNTMPNFKNAFVGMVDACVASDGASFDEVFGPVAMVVNTKWATGEPKPKGFGLAGAIVKIFGMLVKGRLTGSYKSSPFFDAASGAPSVEPRVLSSEEREELRNRALS